MDETLTVEISAKVKNSKGVVTYEKNIDLREMNLQDVVQIQAGVAELENSIAAGQLTKLQAK